MQHNPRTLCITFAVSALILLGGMGGVRKYVDGKPLRCVTHAQAALKRGDLEEASALVRHALQLRANFLPACLVMADICDRKRAPEAVLWRKLIVELSGRSTESLLSYASAALGIGDTARAESALAEIKPADRRRPECQALLGSLTFGLGRYAEAEEYYTQAVGTEPQNTFYRMRLGWAQAMSDEYSPREEGRKALAEIAVAYPDQSLAARRALIMSFEAQGELSLAKSESENLVKTPQHTFADELLRVRLLHDSGAPEFESKLQAIQNLSAANPDDAIRLIHWMNSNGLAAEAVDWVMVRSPKVGKQAALRPAIAMCHLTLENWKALHRLTESNPWDGSEHVRHAYRSRVFHQVGNLLVAYSEWKMAINSAVNQAENLQWLVKTAAGWNWPEQSAEALWAATGQASISRWAFETLYSQYNEQKDSAGMRRVAARLLALNPDDENMQNNLAMFSLLTRDNVERAAEIIEALHKKHPENPDYASTYAFALYSRGRPVEALEALESIPAEFLEQPPFAACYGIILAATRAPKQALHYLQIARNARLFPEEEKMVSEALLTVDDSARGRARGIETALDSSK